MRLQLIWDLDGTLVDSESEIITTLYEAVESVGVSMADAVSPLRIGPPLEEMIRISFSENVLDEEKRKEVVRVFRKQYNASDFEATQPFGGIEDLIRSEEYVHHIITNKPQFATCRILEKKRWSGLFEEIFTPDMLLKSTGSRMTKVEMFQLFRNKHPENDFVAIGDMSSDAQCAKAFGIPAIGVLWGTGTKEELIRAECDDIAADVNELKEILKKYC